MINKYLLGATLFLAVFLLGVRAGMLLEQKFSQDPQDVACSVLCSPLDVVSSTTDRGDVVCVCHGGEQKQVSTSVIEKR